MSTHDDGKALPLTRRELLKKSGTLGGGIAFVTFGPLGCGGDDSGRVRLPTNSGGNSAADEATFLNENEMATLNAMIDRFIPGSPEDLDPGAVAADCAHAINILLSAFSFDPPMIFAGGPFSPRGGAEHNDFEDFVPLDKYEETAWRLKIEGSQGLAEREFNGPRKGWQEIYRTGLARLDERAAEFGLASFAEVPAPGRDLILRDSDDAAIAELVDVAFPHTLDAMYGAPEYGGNRDLVGWGFTEYDGDVQPRGYTDEQVTRPDNPGLFDLLPLGSTGSSDASRLPTAALLPVPGLAELEEIHRAFRNLVAMTSDELSLGMILNSESRLSRLRSEVGKLQPKNSEWAQ